MTLYRRSTKWAAALALGLAGLIGAGTATVLAAPVTGASAFELTLEGKITRTLDGEITSRGTFRSRAPFCATGTFVDEGPIRYGSTKRRFTCDDDSGSLSVSIALREYYAPGTLNTTWQILHGSGSYARLRGGGSLRGELLSEEGFAEWRSTLQGEVDRDAVAPTITISSVTAKKLRRPKDAYALRLRVAFRDNVTDNQVSYTLRASAGRFELARRFGTARTKTVSMTLRIRPPAAARTVRLALTGKDPVGNEVSVRRTLRLPR